VKKLSFTIILGVLPIAAVAQQESLLIGPGDQLSVQVYDTAELNTHGRVTDAGEFPMALIGNVKVSSMTPAQAAEAIDKAFINADVLNHPQVTVTVEQYATQGVKVSGEVKLPGVYATLTPRSIEDVLAIAGGLTTLSDRTLTIERALTHEQIQYFVSNTSKIALDSKVLVYPGDTVVVPKVGVVYILGNVGRPGGVAMSTNDSRISVLQAISTAGGTLPTAVPSKARLIRKTDQGYVEMHLPLSDMQKGKIADIPMKAGDIIYVPYSYLLGIAVSSASLVGEAASAAIYHF
jgi:polysaccharide export outer membrane protein